MSKKDPRKLILEVLRNHPEGLTILSIAEQTGLHRHTSTKYLHELIGANLVFQRRIGAAKLCYLNNKVSEKIEQKKTFEKPQKRHSGQKYGTRLLLTVVILTFLLSETVILAYQNVSIMNGTNLSNISNFNTSPITASNISNSTQVSEFINKTLMGESSSEPNETSGIIEPFVEDSNISENVTSNVSFATNETQENITETNGSVDFNNTIIIESVPELVIEDVSQDKFSITLDYPQKLTRGMPVKLEVTAENIDSEIAKSVFLEYVIPEEFEVESGEISKSCGDVLSGEYCWSEITVKTEFSTLGIKEIKILVHYEE